MKKATKEAILAKLIDGCILRIARKSYVCQGDGTANFKERKFSWLCLHTIAPRIKYIEFEPQAHGAGSRHCLPCAELYFAKKEPERCPFCNHPVVGHNEKKGCTAEVQSTMGFTHECTCYSGDGKTRSDEKEISQ